MYQLVALDIDGTILDSHHRLSARVTAAIRATIATGVQVVLATGKLYRSIEPLVATFGLQGPQITCNGAALVEAPTGRILDQWPLRAEPLRQTLSTLHRVAPGLAIAWYLADRIVTDAPHGWLDEVLGAYHEPAIERIPQLDPDRLPPPLKLLTTGSPSELAARRSATEHLVRDDVQVVRTAIDFLEYMNPLATKGAALAALMAARGIPPAATIAIGDGENDLPLFAVAGMGIAMGNAVPSLRARATAETATNDADGVALALERYILDPPPRR